MIERERVSMTVHARTRRPHSLALMPASLMIFAQ